MKKTKKILKYVFYSLLVCIVSLCCYVFVCLDILHKDYVNVFGYTYFIVVSGSMTGEIEVNDIVFVKITKDVKEKEIIAYLDENKSVITHRLVQINNGKYIAKGDANDTYDKAITKKEIIGRVDYVLTPKVLIELAILIAIIFIALALLNFDTFFKKLFKKQVEEEKKEDKKEEPKKIEREYKEVLPQDIFCSPEERKKFDEHSGLTITIPLDELKELKKRLERQEKFEFKEEATQAIEILELEVENDDIKKVTADRKKQEDNIYSIIEAVLKVKNNAIETTHLTREWQLKYEYIYKLCLILKDEKYIVLDKEVRNVPFKELFNYDINQVGLYKELRDKIYELPIYGLLKVLFYAILYNDEEFFDGVFKIMKYKILIDKNNAFIQVNDKYDKKRLKELIDFMENVANKYNKDESLCLERIKSLNKISNYK